MEASVKQALSDRFISNVAPTPAQFSMHALAHHIVPFRARKTNSVAARKANKVERIETRWNGAETSKDAQPGDYIVTSLGGDDAPLRDGEKHLNTYVIGRDRFSELYQATDKQCEFGRIYRPLGVVTAIKLEGGFDFLAPWGERQTADRGYLILNGHEVYGNNAETFEATYEKIAD